MEELFQYYDTNFKIITRIEVLTDKDEKTINRNKNEFDFRNYKYTIYKNVDDCIAGCHIEMH